MEEYKIISMIAFLILSYWSMGYIFYRIGRKVERMLSFNLQTKITNLKIENGQLQREIDNAEKRIRMMAEANEQMYEEGRKDIIKDTVKEMIIDHEQISFQKLPKKKI
jgi:FtsZ-binding cell division protein ZapB